MHLLIILAATYSDLPNQSYDSAFFYTGTPSPAIFDTSHLVNTLTGVASNSSITTGEYGDASQFSLVTRIKPIFLTAPTDATLYNYYKNDLSDSDTLDDSHGFIQNRFDMLREARWHKARTDFIGDMEIKGFVADMEPTGYE